MANILKLLASSLIPLVLFLITLFIWLYAFSKPKRTLPPSPPKFPIVGNIFQLGLYPHLTLYSLSKKYGQLMLVHLGSKPVLVASSADAAREIMKTHDLIFSNRPKSTIFDKIHYGSKDIAAAPYGEYWRQIRSICVLQLLSNYRVQSFRCIREAETSIMVEKIMRKYSSSPLRAINLSEILKTLTSNVICRVAFGRKYSEDEDGRKCMEILKEAVELLGTSNSDVGDCIPWLAWLNRFNGFNAKVEKVFKEIDQFSESVIQEHKNKKKGKVTNIDETNEESTFVDILLQIQKECSTGFALESDSLKAIIMDMFASGTDTTHATMEWAMTELLRHHKILKKLQDEVRQVAQGKSEITEDDLDSMQYLKAVLKETLRLHTPLPLLVPRESTQHVKVMGYDIPAGTRVLVNAWAISRDPTLWESPEEFQPERFLNSAIDYRGLNFEFVPFGAGRRGCPGISFAITVNEIALAKLVHKFDFALPDGVTIEGLDMSESPGISIHKKHSLFAVATPSMSM